MSGTLLKRKRQTAHVDDENSPSCVLSGATAAPSSKNDDNDDDDDDDGCSNNQQQLQNLKEQGKAQEDSSPAVVATTVVATVPSAVAAAQPLVWQCSACTLENPMARRRCGACESRRPIIGTVAASHHTNTNNTNDTATTSSSSSSSHDGNGNGDNTSTTATAKSTSRNKRRKTSHRCRLSPLPPPPPPPLPQQAAPISSSSSCQKKIRLVQLRVVGSFIHGGDNKTTNGSSCADTNDDAAAFPLLQAAVLLHDHVWSLMTVATTTTTVVEAAAAAATTTTAAGGCCPKDDPYGGGILDNITSSSLSSSPSSCLGVVDTNHRQSTTNTMDVATTTTTTTTTTPTTTPTTSNFDTTTATCRSLNSSSTDNNNRHDEDESMPPPTPPPSSSSSSAALSLSHNHHPNHDENNPGATAAVRQYSFALSVSSSSSSPPPPSATNCDLKTSSSGSSGKSSSSNNEDSSLLPLSSCTALNAPTTTHHHRDAMLNSSSDKERVATTTSRTTTSLSASSSSCALSSQPPFQRRNSSPSGGSSRSRKDSNLAQLLQNANPMTTTTMTTDGANNLTPVRFGIPVPCHPSMPMADEETADVAPTANSQLDHTNSVICSDHAPAGATALQANWTREVAIAVSVPAVGDDDEDDINCGDGGNGMNSGNLLPPPNHVEKDDQESPTCTVSTLDIPVKQTTSSSSSSTVPRSGHDEKDHLIGRPISNEDSNTMCGTKAPSQPQHNEIDTMVEISTTTCTPSSNPFLPTALLPQIKTTGPGPSVLNSMPAAEPSKVPMVAALGDAWLQDSTSDTQTVPLSSTGGQETTYQGLVEPSAQHFGWSPTASITSTHPVRGPSNIGESYVTHQSDSSTRIDSEDCKSPVSSESKHAGVVGTARTCCPKENDQAGNGRMKSTDMPGCLDIVSPAVQAAQDLLEEDPGVSSLLKQQFRENTMKERASTILPAAFAGSDLEHVSQSDKGEIHPNWENVTAPTRTSHDAACAILNDAPPNEASPCDGLVETLRESTSVHSPLTSADNDERNDLDNTPKTSENEQNKANVDSAELLQDVRDSDKMLDSSQSERVSLLPWQPITQQDDGQTSLPWDRTDPENGAVDQSLACQQPARHGDVGQFFYTQASQSQEELSQGSQNYSSNLLDSCRKDSDRTSTSPHTQVNHAPATDPQHVSDEISSPMVYEDTGDDAKVCASNADPTGTFITGNTPTTVRTTGASLQTTKLTPVVELQKSGFDQYAGIGILSFKTAGRGIALRVSDDSLARANRLLGETSGSQAIPHTPHAHSATPASFRTAGLGSTIEVSSDAMAKAERICTSKSERKVEPPIQKSSGVSFHAPNRGVAFHVSDHGNRLLEGEANSQCKTPAHRPARVSFQTAGRGVPLQVDDSSIAKANRLFEEKSGVPNPYSNEATMQRPARVSFQTARQGLELRVAENSNAKASRLVGQMSHSKTDVAPPPNSRPSAMPAFQTAGSGSLIQISSAAMAKAEGIYGINTDNESAIPAQRPARVSFQTTSQGLARHAADSSITTANRLAGGISTAQMTGQQHQHPYSDAKTPVQRPPRVSFQTAGRSIKLDVPAAAMAKASCLLGQLSYLETAAASPPTRPPAMPAFQTAGSGSCIPISSAAMAQAELICGTKTDTPSMTPVQRPPRVSFQTAGRGLALEVSAAGMAKADLLLGELSHSEDVAVAGPPYSQPTDIPTFQNAGAGSLIRISSAAMAKAERIHGTNADNESVTPVQRPARVSFQTAGRGDALLVSDANIAEVNRLFEETSNAQAFVYGQYPISNAKTQVQRPARVSFAAAGCGDALHVCDAGISKPYRFFGDFYGTRATIQEGFAECDAKTSASFQSPLDAETTSDLPLHQTQRTMLCCHEVSSETVNGLTAPIPGACAAPCSALQSVHDTSIGHVGEPNGCDRGSVSGTWPGSPSKMQRPPVVSMVDVTYGSPAQPQVEGKVTSRPFLTKESADALHDAFKEGNMVDDPMQCMTDGVNIYTLRVDAINSMSLRFDRMSGLPCDFITNTEVVSSNSVGSLSDIRHALNARGCDCSKINDKWILNHSRWIIWKLASRERRFSSFLAGRHLTYIRLVDQLEHRFDKEVRNGKRPAIRKVLNRDVSSTTMMVLCVARIFELPKAGAVAESSVRLSTHSPLHGVNPFAMELTDGWYSVIAQLDSPLCRMVKNFVIRPGTKIMVSNAALVGGDEGVDPLDESYDPTRNDNGPYLRLTINATRLAHWRAKLGFLKPSPQLQDHGGMLLVRKLRDVIDGGGSLPLIEFTVTRKYQLVYLAPADSCPEKHMDAEASHSRFLTAEEELSRRESVEKIQGSLGEKFSREVEAEVAADVDENAPDAWFRVVKSPCPSELFEQLTMSEREDVNRWKERRAVLIHDRVRKEIEAKFEEHDVVFTAGTACLRMLVKDFVRSSADEVSTEALLTVWNPSQEQLDLLTEGTSVRAKNLGVKNHRRDGLLQLSANGRTAFSRLSTLQASTGRSTMGIARLHALSQKNNGLRWPEVDVAGVLLRSQRLDQQGQHLSWDILLSDRSGMVLRVVCKRKRAEDDSWFASGIPARENITSTPTIVSFRDLRLLPFDRDERWAMAEFREISTMQCNTMDKATERLRLWSRSSSGQSSLRSLAASVDARIPFLFPSRTRCFVSIGHITGFTVVSRELLVQVDSGGGALNVWRFPHKLILASDLGKDGQNNVFLNIDEEMRISATPSLSKLFRSRELCRFQLQPNSRPVAECPDCTFEVVHVTRADKSALADVYCELVR